MPKQTLPQMHGMISDDPDLKYVKWIPGNVLISRKLADKTQTFVN